jgi:Tol biopolymer transport system component
VITFPDGDVAHPTITRYPVFGSVYGAGSFSGDGSRFAMPVPAGQHGLAIHVLEGGTDTVVATVPTFDVAVPMVWISWAPDAASLAIVTTEIAGPRLTLVSVADGEVRQLGRPDGLGPRASLESLAWSPDGRRLVVRQDTGEAWVLDATQGQWQALGLTVPDALSISLPDERLQWSSDGRLAVVVGTTVTIHNFDGTPDRQVDLPGQIAAWSPDGTMIATLASSAGDPAVIWATDPWDTGESQRIASVPGTAPPDTTNPPCIQWLPEVHP